MAERYMTIRDACTGKDVEVKKSRFISDASPAGSSDEAAAFIDKCRKKYYDAKHHCFAYIIGNDDRCIRYSDDGEPSGTAGRPILEVMNGAGLKDTVVVVTRYFGGTLLGTGGLVRAYSQSASSVLEAADILTITHGIKINASVDYAGFGRIKYYLDKEGIQPENVIYGENISFEICIVAEHETDIVRSMKELTDGRVDITGRSEGEFEIE